MMQPHPLLKTWKTPPLELLAQVGIQRLKKPGPDIHGRQHRKVHQFLVVYLPSPFSSVFVSSWPSGMWDSATHIQDGSSLLGLLAYMPTSPRSTLMGTSENVLPNSVDLSIPSNWQNQSSQRQASIFFFLNKCAQNKAERGRELETT